MPQTSAEQNVKLISEPEQARRFTIFTLDQMRLAPRVSLDVASAMPHFVLVQPGPWGIGHRGTPNQIDVAAGAGQKVQTFD